MKKITAASRVIDLFSNQPIEVCEGLLDIAQSILKQRRGTAPKKARKTPTRYNPATGEDEPLQAPAKLTHIRGDV